MSRGGQAASEKKKRGCEPSHKKMTRQMIVRASILLARASQNSQSNRITKLNSILDITLARAFSDLCSHPLALWPSPLAMSRFFPSGTCIHQSCAETFLSALSKMTHHSIIMPKSKKWKPRTKASVQCMRCKQIFKKASLWEDGRVHSQDLSVHLSCKLKLSCHQFCVWNGLFPIVKEKYDF